MPSPGTSSRFPPTRGRWQKFGIDPKNMFEFWDWVGGRYSLWSAIGLSIAVAIGMENFEELLAGAFAMDEHFRTDAAGTQHPGDSCLARDLVQQFLRRTELRHPSLRPVPPSLSGIPPAGRHGEQRQERHAGRATRVDYSTGPIVWGEPGTNGQHAFYQLIHQGTKLIPADFIAPIETHNPDWRSSRDPAFELPRAAGGADEREDGGGSTRGASGRGRESETPSTGWFRTRSSPETSRAPPSCSASSPPVSLGSLIALYEHKIFVQGIVWNINSFDQWGVELGKQLAKKILPELKSKAGRSQPRCLDERACSIT